MGIMLSPGVLSREIDKSQIVSSVASTTAALVGYSTKGAVAESVISDTGVRLITTTQQFIAEYGEPVPGNYFHYSGLAYLENGNKLYCLRIDNGALYGGVDIKKSDSVENNAGLGAGKSTPQFVSSSGADNLFVILGKDPGNWNNSIGIQITNVDETDYTFDINVYWLDDDTGEYTLQETWTVSRKQQIDGYGKQQYLETVINDFSDYIKVYDSVSYSDSVMPKAQATTLAFLGGNNGSAVADSHYITGWETFENPDDIDIRILIGGGITSVAVQTEIKAIAEGRKDCIALFDMPYAQLSSVASQITWRESTQNINSSYTALFSPWVKIYDQYNGMIVEIPPSGYIASQIAYNDYVAEPWYAPAGTNRGILNVIGLTNVFTQGERDLLYEAGINPIQTWRSRGNVIWGQKTQQVKASALDRINVRRSLIIIEKSIAIGLVDFVFELNNETTRLKVTSMIEEYLDTLASRGAFQTENDKGYVVVCDETNNTPAVIDRNELYVDVYVKPARTAEFIRLSTVIVNSGVTFTEMTARGLIV